MPTPRGYASFLVRLWREGNTPKIAVVCHGEVEHIQSGRRWTFGTLDETLSFLRRRANNLEELDLLVDE